MSIWRDQWRDFIREGSYVQHLRDEKISNDQFWRSYAVYDRALMHSGYPGEILSKISSFISPGSILLDIGAGTGAFAIPLSRQTSRTIAIDPSAYQLKILMQKAREMGLKNIITIQKEWKDVQGSDIFESSHKPLRGHDIDYSLAANSLFDEDIQGFLEKMIEVTRKGIFIVFRADQPDSLNEFAYGPRPYADYLCLYHILKEIGHQFDIILFSRNYILPLDIILMQHRFSRKSPEEIIDHLETEGRLGEGGKWASFSTRDALIYKIL